MQREAENHPADGNYPGPARRELQLPDEPENESGQKSDIGDGEVTEGARVHFLAVHFKFVIQLPRPAKRWQGRRFHLPLDCREQKMARLRHRESRGV